MSTDEGCANRLSTPTMRAKLGFPLFYRRRGGRRKLEALAGWGLGRVMPWQDGDGARPIAKMREIASRFFRFPLLSRPKHPFFRFRVHFNGFSVLPISRLILFLRRKRRRDPLFRFFSFSPRMSAMRMRSSNHKTVYGIRNTSEKVSLEIWDIQAIRCWLSASACRLNVSAS